MERGRKMISLGKEKILVPLFDFELTNGNKLTIYGSLHISLSLDGSLYVALKEYGQVEALENVARDLLEAAVDTVMAELDGAKEE